MLLINTNQLREACLDNSKDLLDEALDLFKARKYSRATLLAITSYEESLKAALILSFENGNLNESQFKKIYYKHELKLLSRYARVDIYEELKSGKITTELTTPVERAKDVEEMIKLRNQSLYVDFSNNKITTPKEITIHVANKFIKIAKVKLDWELMVSKLFEMLKKEKGQNRNPTESVRY